MWADWTGETKLRSSSAILTLGEIVFEGGKRGVVPNITDVFSRPTLEERDLMYGYQNAIDNLIRNGGSAERTPKGYLMCG